MKLSDAVWIGRLLEAVSRGERLQAYYNHQNGWIDVSLNENVHFSFGEDRYRIKPKVPEYRLYTRPSYQGMIGVCQRNGNSTTEVQHRKICEESSKSDSCDRVVWLTDWLPLPERK